MSRRIPNVLTDEDINPHIYNLNKNTLTDFINTLTTNTVKHQKYKHWARFLGFITLNCVTAFWFETENDYLFCQPSTLSRDVFLVKLYARQQLLTLKQVKAILLAQHTLITSHIPVSPFI